VRQRHQEGKFEPDAMTYWQVVQHCQRQTSVDGHVAIREGRVELQCSGVDQLDQGGPATTEMQQSNG